MPRYVANTVFLAKVETTAGTDAAPTGAADAVLLCDINVDPLDIKYVDRTLIRTFMGGGEQLAGFTTVKASVTFELAGSGTAGTAPAWGKMLLGCAMAEAVLATPARVEYTPVSTGLKTITGYYYDDGVLHKLVGAMGNPKFDFSAGDRPKCTVDIIGLDGGISAATNVTATLTSWKVPPAIKGSNVTQDITLGCTYAAGALTGGTQYVSTGFSVDMGNQVALTELLTERIDIPNRAVSGSMQLELTAAQEVALYANVRNCTTTGLGFILGTVAGAKLLAFAPAVQLTNVKKAEVNGARAIGYDLRLLPSATGNDEWRLVAL